MSIVFLKRDWFDQNGQLWSARNNPHEIEDQETLDNLPTDAIVDGEDPTEPKPKTKTARALARELKEAGEQGIAEKERQEKIVQKAESEHNDKAHAAVTTKTATPPKL